MPSTTSIIIQGHGPTYSDGNNRVIVATKMSIDASINTSINRKIQPERTLKAVVSDEQARGSPNIETLSPREPRPPCRQRQPNPTRGTISLPEGFKSWRPEFGPKPSFQVLAFLHPGLALFSGHLWLASTHKPSPGAGWQRDLFCRFDGTAS